MKVLLIGFKLSVGNRLYIEILKNNLIKEKYDVSLCGDGNYIKTNIICNGGNSLQMIFDTLNPLNIIKFIMVIKRVKPRIIFFVSSHSLNLPSILVGKMLFSRIKYISHIHDPIAHSGTWYSSFIFQSQKFQSKFSDVVVCYGNQLKKIISYKYKIDLTKVHVIKHGAYRSEEISNRIEESKTRKYFTLLGRIDKYKGIDVFLRLAFYFYKKYPSSDFTFILGGLGDLTPYELLIKKIPPDKLLIFNSLLTDDEFDKILQKSAAFILPYKDGTQTGNTPVAYFNGCPVIVSNVGSLPEIVINGKTGFIFNTFEDLFEIVESISLGIYDVSELSKNAFEYYNNELKWSRIIHDIMTLFNDYTERDIVP